MWRAGFTLVEASELECLIVDVYRTARSPHDGLQRRSVYIPTKYNGLSSQSVPGLV